jgi:abortive infection bacteriophage resistance protein
MPYPKPWMSVADQLAQLTSRGMQVSDEAKAADYLERIGYYRLSGYWYDFRTRSAYTPLDPATGGKPKKVRIERPVLDEFKPGTRFHDAADLYVFDKQLRLLALDALERIEVALRVDLSHRLGEKDSFAYLKPDLFHENFSNKLDPTSGLTRHHEWLTKHAALVARSRETFMVHNKKKYGLPLAIWVACEVWNFGSMSTLFAGLKSEDQDAIAQAYGVPDGRVFESWLRSLNYLRNVCAHHSRLWNRNVVEEPKLPASGVIPALDAFIGDAARRTRPFLLLCICQHLMQVINPSSTWGRRLKKHLLEEFPDLSHIGITLHGMGVDEGWDQRAW